MRIIRKLLIIICRTLYVILLCTWGFFQSLAGLVCFMTHIRCRHEIFNACVVTRWHSTSGISLGIFIFIPDEKWIVEENIYYSRRQVCTPAEFADMVKVHEYGHTVQSAVMGPLFAVPGIWSVIWANSKHFQEKRRKEKIDYSRAWPERWANRLGERITGKRSLGIEEGQTLRNH